MEVKPRKGFGAHIFSFFQISQVASYKLQSSINIYMYTSYDEGIVQLYENKSLLETRQFTRVISW